MDSRVGRVGRRQEVEVRANLRPWHIAQHLQSFAVLYRAVHDRREALVQLRDERILPQAKEHPVAVAMIAARRLCPYAESVTVERCRRGVANSYQTRAFLAAEHACERHHDGPPQPL